MKNSPEKEEINKEDRQPSSSLQLAQIKQVVHIGPLPPPEILERYGEIDPSFPERIFHMAEKEQKFRHRSYYIGQIMALVIVIVGLLSAVYLGVNGKEWLGGTIGLGALASIVGAYFYSQKTKKENSA